MEMSDDEIEEKTETKETEESGKDNSALFYLNNIYLQGWYFKSINTQQVMGTNISD